MKYADILAQIPMNELVKAVLAAAARDADVIEAPPTSTVTKALGITIAIQKSDVDLKHGVIFGVASSLRNDKQDDAVADDYELAQGAYNFMAKANKRATNTHGPDIGGDFVASWVEDGKWRIGFRPHDIEIAKAAARGEFVGFSVGGQAERVDE